MWKKICLFCGFCLFASTITISADELEDAQGALNKYKTEYENAKEEKDVLEQQVSDLEQKISDCASNIEEIKVLLANAQTEMQDAVDDSAPKSSIDIQIWSKTVAKATNPARSEIVAYEERLDSLQDEQKELKSDLEDAKTALSEQTAIMWDYDYLSDTAESTINDLQEQKEEEKRLQEEANQKAAEAEQEAALAQEDSESSSVSSSEIVTAPYVESTGNAIVDAAYSQLGVPYVWGGATPGKAFDCSGLVQYCLRQAGIKVSHSSTAIGQGGTMVTDPQPGDIVCYSGHCAIYIGNGKMIHAPHTGTVVKIASVYGHPWYRRYQ